MTSGAAPANEDEAVEAPPGDGTPGPALPGVVSQGDNDDGAAARLGEFMRRLSARAEARAAPLVALFVTVRDRVRRHPVFGEVYEVVDGVFLDYGRDHGAMYAGALTFYAILSLIPLAVLFASVFGFVMSAGNSADVQEALDEVVRQLRKVVPYLQPSFAQDLRTVVEYRSRLGLVGFVALLWAASEVFRGVEFATARIFARLDDHATPTQDKTQARSVFTTKLLFGAVVTSVVIAYFLLRLVGSVLSQVRAKLDLPSWVGTLLGDPLGEGSVLAYLVTASAIIAAFVVVVRVFSPHKVQTRYALFGGGLFFVFFEAAHRVYDLYNSRVTDPSAMYGSFATLVVLLLWIYYCAVLLLVCCHATKVAQRRMTIGPRWPRDGSYFLLATPQPSDATSSSSSSSSSG